MYMHACMYVCICPVTMVSVGYHCGLSVIYPQFELAVRHLGINHYCSLSLMSNHFSCLPTVHDTENLTFSEEFRGCSTRNDADFPHGCRGTSAQATRIFLAGRRGSSAQTGTNLPCGFGLKMAETRRRTSCATTLNDRETRRKDRSKYHYRTRTC